MAAALPLCPTAVKREALCNVLVFAVYSCSAATGYRHPAVREALSAARYNYRDRLAIGASRLAGYARYTYLLGIDGLSAISAISRVAAITVYE